MIGGARSEGEGIGPTREELFALELDLRLMWLWRQIWDGPESDYELLAPYIRYAYGAGYADALTEEVRGKLYREHCYDVPKRRKRGAA